MHWFFVCAVLAVAVCQCSMIRNRRETTNKPHHSGVGNDGHGGSTSFQNVHLKYDKKHNFSTYEHSIFVNHGSGKNDPGHAVINKKLVIHDGKQNVSTLIVGGHANGGHSDNHNNADHTSKQKTKAYETQKHYQNSLHNNGDSVSHQYSEGINGNEHHISSLGVGGHTAGGYSDKKHGNNGHSSGNKLKTYEGTKNDKNGYYNHSPSFYYNEGSLGGEHRISNLSENGYINGGYSDKKHGNADYSSGHKLEIYEGKYNENGFHNTDQLSSQGNLGDEHHTSNLSIGGHTGGGYSDNKDRNTGYTSGHEVETDEGKFDQNSFHNTDHSPSHYYSERNLGGEHHVSSLDVGGYIGGGYSDNKDDTTDYTSRHQVETYENKNNENGFHSTDQLPNLYYSDKQHISDIGGYIDDGYVDKKHDNDYSSGYNLETNASKKYKGNSLHNNDDSFISHHYSEGDHGSYYTLYNGANGANSRYPQPH